MTSKQFNKLDQMEKFDLIEQLGVQVALYRCISGAGEVRYNGTDTICKNRESLIAQVELMFVMLDGKDGKRVVKELNVSNS